MTINGDLVANLGDATGQLMTLFLPLWSVIIGIFVSFAILNMLGEMLRKTLGKK